MMEGKEYVPIISKPNFMKTKIDYSDLTTQQLRVTNLDEYKQDIKKKKTQQLATQVGQLYGTKKL